MRNPKFTNLLASSFASTHRIRAPSCRSPATACYYCLLSARKTVNLGFYATPDEAALHVARELAAQPAVQQPPATSSRKRNGRGQFRSEEQPPDMPMDMPSDGVVILEGQFVESGN